MVFKMDHDHEETNKKKANVNTHPDSEQMPLKIVKDAKLKENLPQLRAAISLFFRLFLIIF